MGLYINPENKRKEAWLAENGKQINLTQAEAIVMAPDYIGKEVVVCLVNNGRFTAAGIAYCKEEFEAMRWSGDTRPKEWWSVPRDRFEGDFNTQWKIIE